MILIATFTLSLPSVTTEPISPEGYICIIQVVIYTNKVVTNQKAKTNNCFKHFVFYDVKLSKLIVINKVIMVPLLIIDKSEQLHTDISFTCFLPFSISNAKSHIETCFFYFIKISDSGGADDRSWDDASIAVEHTSITRRMRLGVMEPPLHLKDKVLQLPPDEGRTHAVADRMGLQRRMVSIPLLLQPVPVLVDSTIFKKALIFFNA